jgi:O-antigen/teichoic acid export membrane protein
LKKILTDTNINLFTNVLNQILGIGFPIIIQFYTIRHFNIADLGYLNLLNSYWSVFALGLSFFNFYLLKIFASKKDEKDVKSYLTNATILMYSFFAIPFVIFLAFLYYKYPDIFEMTFLTSLPIITAPVSFEIYFQASLKNTYILIRRLIIRSLFVVLMLSLAKVEADFIVYVYILCISTSAENLINLLFINKYISFKLINFSVIHEIARNSLRYLPFNLTYNLMPNISIIGASHFVLIDEVTIYSLLVRIVNLSTSFITSAVMVLYPVKVNVVSNNLSKKYEDGKYLKNTLYVSIAVALVLIIFHPFIFQAFLKDYEVENMLTQFAILTGFIVCHSIYNYITFNYYFIKDRTFFISIINVILLVVYVIELALVELGIINFNFSLLYILPYPFALALIYQDIRNNRKRSL